MLRRLSLDLHQACRPLVAEVDAFLKDESKDAYETQVERLLESPHYGERWGRLWLDAARYADSDGYEKDKSRKVYFYRDWVIAALNRDLPYNQFIIDQIAGDLLPGATQDQIVATGFLRNSMVNEEGGIDPEQFRMEAMFDRMDAIGKGILGLTIQCAQCHSHKFDPLTQEEYYRMFAFLNNTHEANMAVYTPDEQMKRAEIFRKIHEIEARLRHEHPDWPAKMEAWENSVKNNQPPWQVVRTEIDANNDSGQKHYRLEDGSILAAGYAPTKFTTEFTALEPVKTVTRGPARAPERPQPAADRAGPLERGPLCPDRVSPGSRAGRQAAIRRPRSRSGAPRPTSIRRSACSSRSSTTGASRRRVTGPIAYAIDGKDETAWGIDAGPGRRNVPRNAVFVLEKPVSFPAGTILTFKLTQRHGGWNSDDNQNNNLGRFRFSVTDRPDAAADPCPGTCARSWRSRGARRTAGPDGGRLQLLANHRRRLEGGERPDRSALEAASRRAHRSSCSRSETSRARRTCSSAAISSSRASRSRPARPRSSTRFPPTSRPTA